MNVLNKKSVEDIDVKGKKVLVRCDFNVKMENGVITSDKRIVASLPTIKYLLDNGAKLILCSHLGRPKGEFKPEFSLAPVAARLGELLGLEVKMAKDVIGESAQSLAADLKEGEVLLLENVRFHAEETKNDPEFSKALASLLIFVRSFYVILYFVVAYLFVLRFAITGNDIFIVRILTKNGIKEDTLDILILRIDSL